FHERPLVRVHRPARGSPIPPEIENHHLAAIVAELECLAFDIFALDVGRNLTNGTAEFADGSSETADVRKFLADAIAEPNDLGLQLLVAAGTPGEVFCQSETRPGFHFAVRALRQHRAQ